MAVTATFSSGLLTEIGDSGDNTMVTSRDAAGRLLVNSGAVPIAGGTATVANTTLIQAFGQGGSDTIALNEANGALPAADLFGGPGNDTITGGSGNDLLFGQDGDDTLLGKGGNDQLFGGTGADTLTGGDGDDQVFGQAGNDRMIWNPGDDSDVFEGGDGSDVAVVNGGNGAETFAITANGTRVRFDRLMPAPFFLDIGTTESLVLNAGGGDDVVTAGNGLASLISLAIDGGDGNDTITGGDGADTLLGGAGNDVVIGGRGSDLALLGAGDDAFVWNPGDGSDTVEGQTGVDTLVFNGANINERIEVSANGARARLTRDVANITMDLNGIEKIDVIARGGADQITVGDLIGTGVTEVAIDLSGGASAGDGAADSVKVNGTARNDAIGIQGSGASVSVTGLPARVDIAEADAGDSLTVAAGAGADRIDASALPAGIVGLTIDGGDGNDTITGSQGADTLVGGDGADAVTGGRGDDLALLGAGNDKFTWNPGDGSDVVEGQDGVDTLLFNGSNANERIDISANGGRVRLSRDVANITMDLNGVEQIKLATLGGADTVTVNDLTGTGVSQIVVDLATPPGGVNGDSQPDSVILNASAANDTISVVSIGSWFIVDGLSEKMTVGGFDPGVDALTIDGLSGDDTIDASRLHAGEVNLTINGGAGADRITGSPGADFVTGGTGADLAMLGGGDDLFVWNPGDGSDIVDGQGGVDTLLFNGANINERIDISANGSRARLTRDVANIAMDLNAMEAIDVAARGGADTLTVDDLTGTAVKSVNIDAGGADGQADAIVINATGGDDVITATNTGGLITVTGLAATVTISGFEATDSLVINGLGGDDVISASGLSGILLTANGGDGDDVVIGGPGDDVLTGGAGDDVLIGGAGADVLDGGSGDNVVIQAIVAHGAPIGGLPQAMETGFAATAGAQAGPPLFDPQANRLPLLAAPHS